MSDNPFLSRERFPRFDRLTPESAREALPVLIAETEAKVAALEARCEPTWAGRVAALTDALEPFSRAWHLVGHMLGVRNSDDWRAVEGELQPHVVRLSLRVAQSRPLYDALLALRGGPAWSSLDEGRRRVVEAAIRDARDAGVGRDGPARERFLEIATRLSELSTKFSNNTLDATKAFALDSRMAKTPEAVYAMIDRIGAAALPRAREELAALRAFAAENGAPGELRHWDLAYWSRRRLEALYGYSSETLRPYLPFPRVLDGLFGLARELFGVAIEPCDGLAPVWHPDVRLFRVRDAESGAELAHFYLDPYSRPAEKQGGAWMDEICNRAERPDGSVRLPLALLCCNQAPPSGGKPSLMTLGEVDTLFHEFGHALQGMLTRVGIPEAAGIANVEWDAVELASQFLENWHDLPAQLRALSAHVGTGEPIPEDLIAKIQGAKTYNQGLATVRQLRFALADMDLHERVPCAEMPDAEAAWAAASARFALLPPLPGERFLNTFTHIFSGGYAAGYYSYMWADILAHDAFAAFEEAGLDDPAARAATGRRYAATILALGGSRAPADVFRDFRGRDPDPAALLRHKGLA